MLYKRSTEGAGTYTTLEFTPSPLVQELHILLFFIGSSSSLP